MSVDQGDVDNDGRLEIFTTDMKPYDSGVHTLASWLPMMATMPQVEPRADPQRVRNVLQMRGADGRYHDEAIARSVDATGWSWSGKFGDLDERAKYADVPNVNARRRRSGGCQCICEQPNRLEVGLNS